jgi:hypothetical protein
MRTRFFALGAVILFSATTAQGIAAADRKCEFSGGYEVDSKPTAVFLNDFVTRFKYTSPKGKKYNTARFLEATAPRFRLADSKSGWQGYWAEAKFDPATKSVVSHHCLQTVVDVSKKISLNFADRIITFGISDLHPVNSVNDGVAIIQRSSQEPFDIGTETPPDWLDLVSGRVIEAQGKTFLQVRLHNTGDQEIREHALHVGASNSNSHCMSTPQKTQAELTISSADGKVTASATDLNFDTLRELSNVDKQLGPCGEISFDFDLGDLPPIQPDQDYYINYRVSEKQAQSGSSFFKDFPYLVIEVSGGRAFPTRISVNSK